MIDRAAVRFSQLAASDIMDGHEWYDHIRPGLGDALLIQIEAAVRYVARHPEGSACVLGNVRRKIIRRFPYAVFYRVAGSGIEIIGVRPTAGDPDSLAERMR